MDRRLTFRKGLSTLYLPHYDALCALLPPEWQPYYGLRTFPQQDLLFAQGRSRPGKIVTNAKGGESPHCYGCASDWCLWEDGKPVWPEKGSPLWLPYVNAAEKIGLRSGIEWGDYPHNELKIDCGWRHVRMAYDQGGMLVAQQKIDACNLSG